MAITTLNNRSINRSDTASSGQLWTATSATASDFQAAAAAGFTLVSPVASTSGTSIAFTSIPAGIKRFEILFNAVGSSGTNHFELQLGDAGGLETSGYASPSFYRYAATTHTNSPYDAGAASHGTGDEAGNTCSGAWSGYLFEASSYTWVMTHMHGTDNQTRGSYGTSLKSLSGELDRISVNWHSADTFDAGSISLMYQ